jgi:flagellar export protein FliJ
MKEQRLNLASVLNYRRWVEERFQQELARLHEDLLREEELLESLVVQKEQSIHQLSDRNQTEIILNEVLLYHRFLNKVEEEIEKQIKRLNGIRELYQNKREELIHSSQEKKKLEILTENRTQVEQYNRLKKERAFVDELSIQRHHRGDVNEES